MTKLALTGLTTLTNEASALTALNQNFNAIIAAIENTVSLDGTTPNTMSAALDLGSNQVINAAAPTSGPSLANKAYVDARSFDTTLGATVATNAANAATSETNAAASAVEAGLSIGSRMDNDGTFAIGTPYDINATVRWTGGYSRSNIDNNLGNQPTAVSDANWSVVTLDGIDGSNGTGAVDSVSGGTGITNTGTGTDPIMTLDTVAVSSGGTGAITAAAARTNLGLGTASVLASTAVLEPSVTNNLTAGYTGTAHNYGTVTTGTTTVDITKGAQAYYTNNGAHTLAPDTGVEGAQDIVMTNGASAVIPIVTGFILKGDDLDAVSGNDFLLSTKRINGFDILVVVALQ